MSTPSKRPFALSPAKQALLARALRGQDTGAPNERIQRRSSAGPVRLSHEQERLWFLDQLEPGRSIYNVHFAFRLEGELDPDRIASITVEAAGYAPASFETVRTALDPDPDAFVVQLAAGTLVRGRVVEQESGAPVEGARVRQLPFLPDRVLEALRKKT